jgi:NADH:ubiquinone oxidoreductase subunit 4 (subunit M)
MGIYPSLFLDAMHASVENLVERYHSALAAAQHISVVAK